MKILIAFLIATPCFASLQNPLKSDYIDFSKINLSDYVKKKADTIVEKNQSQEDSKLTVYFVFEKKLNEVERKLLMHVFDLNGDSKLDMAKHYVNGKVSKMEFDLDNDGKVDEVTVYDPKTGDIQKKTSSQSQSNIWRYWFKGELRLMELDRNNDKKPDMWLHYRKDKVVKTEVDADYDGKKIKEVK